MPFFSVSDLDKGAEQTIHLTPYKSGQIVDLFNDLQLAEAALKQLPGPGDWRIQEVCDLLPWYVELSQAGVTHIREVATSSDAGAPKNIHLLISNLRTTGTLDAF